MSKPPSIPATIQLCTYNRAALLERVLDACFEQNCDPESYEVVLVNDGSTDGTEAVIEQAKMRATCAFTVITQANAGLARGRNVGIEAARGERIIFIDDDVLPLPTFVGEHLLSHREHRNNIVRGGAINVESFDDLPPPLWSFKNYSGNYFWTTNVSVPIRTIRAIGGFNESFSEYGWEDIDVGLRLRFGGVKATFNPKALAYHYKPTLRGRDVEKAVRQAQAQARTAIMLAQLHPHWRTYLATGNNPLQRAYHALLRRRESVSKSQEVLASRESEKVLTRRQLRAVHQLVRDAYFRELEATLALTR